MRRVLLIGMAWAVAATAGAADLESVAAAVAARPAWSARFVQVYVPAGFDSGTEDHGTLLLAPPDRVRFDYPERVFAVDGAVATMVDRAAGSCETFRLDETNWGRLPLSALLDPGAALGFFAVEPLDDGLRLTPHEPTPDLAAIDIVVGDGDMPAEVTVEDEAGNRNRFRFSQWAAASPPAADAFRPVLPGIPCAAGGG